ncbi:6-phosphofructo-2-kinase/fructose-2,6-bisphosphatase 1 [Lepeophtheirus salmonis]|uniref:6-phosphofructo-2-kinase domain-containing protein n=1 Tax=Lepeophtheirus salmonis TaxID=72036 RepID=A0A0K2TN45_LEPSM|nr:6-phosphofructo-2-kinase/fructose-2,6-bisphosphatase 1-like [Lepeophtheirus salmonis]XP_040576910.1 6-phosphofructo-2-kinase/fructose-2,6-bisphosphatase 1-like [Lepeophtheirus salmonis]
MPGLSDPKIKEGFISNGEMMRTKYLIVMVGLPARGKTYISSKLCRYLNWIGVEAKVFNVGQYRRKATDQYRNSDFFSPTNEAAMTMRENVAKGALRDALRWLYSLGDAVIFDATNSTVERRKWVYEMAMSYSLDDSDNEIKVIFLESVCNDPKVIDSTVREVKVNGLDYVGVDMAEAQRDFSKRIQHYEKTYVKVGSVPEEAHYSYTKIIDAGEEFILHRNEGYLHARIAYWLMNTHIQPRSIYLTRHGESEYNVLGRIGGDSELTSNGRQYARLLADYFKKNVKNDKSSPKVLTSMLKRSLHTAAKMNLSPHTHRKWKLLNEIDAGICEELTYEQILQQFPEVYRARRNDKLGFRYPGGESYRDVITRLEPVIMELERSNDVLVVSHQAVIRCILAYFTDGRIADMPFIEIPLHTLIKLTPSAQGCDVSYISFDVPAVNTHHDSRKKLVCVSSLTGVDPSLNKDIPPIDYLGVPQIVVTPATPDKRCFADHIPKCRDRSTPFETNGSNGELIINGIVDGTPPKRNIV